MSITLVVIVLVASAIQFAFGYYKGFKNGVIKGYYAADRIKKVLEQIRAKREAAKENNNANV